MTSNARLSLVILAVRELSRATRFYADVFGWTVAVDVPDRDHDGLAREIESTRDLLLDLLADLEAGLDFGTAWSMTSSTRSAAQHRRSS